MDNRFYFQNPVGAGRELNVPFSLCLTGQEAQHLIKVRRAKVGDKIVAFNGDGFDYHFEVNEILKDKVNLTLISKAVNPSSKSPKITVYLAMIKNEALVEAIDHLAELNVKSVKLFKADYSVANFDNKKLEKLTQTAIQASKQSERADVMQIEIINKNQIKLDAPQNTFFAYENSTGKIGEFAGEFALIIGPEGGFSQEEVNYFSSFSKNISLGNTILRAEVACVAGVSMLKAVNNAC